MQTNGLIFHLHKSYIYNSLTMEDGLLFHYIKVATSEFGLLMLILLNH